MNNSDSEFKTNQKKNGYQIKPEVEDIKVSVYVISAFSVIHFIIFALYTVFVFSKLDFYYGYENLEKVPYAVFVDRRYNFFWVVYFIQLARIIVYFLYLLSADTTRYSYLVYILHKTFNRIYLFLDIIFIIILLVLGWIHNSSWFADNPCNSPLFCNAYGNQYDTLCSANSYVATEPNFLESNQLCAADFWFTLTFLLLDIIMYLNAKSFHLNMSLYKLKEGID
jgi:hypothetical protein